MCDWCSAKTPEDKKRARDAALRFASEHEQMARHYRDIAAGRDVHHNEAAKRAGQLARSIIRELVAEFM